MTILGSLMIRIGKSIEKLWHSLKQYSRKCRRVYHNVLST